MIDIYTAREAKDAADAFYGPLCQIFSVIRERAKDGLYVLRVVGTELSPKQVDVLVKNGYQFESTREEDQVVYIISWQ